MRHRKKKNLLKKKSLLKNLAKSLIRYKRIKTTLSKAKALRIFIEPLITKSKTNSMHSRRQVFAHFQDKEPVKTLFNEIAFKVGNRPGGYTRTLRLQRRLGDNAEMALIELVDYNEYLPTRQNTKKNQNKDLSHPLTV